MKVDVINELARFIQKIMKAAGVGLLVITPDVIVQTPTKGRDESDDGVGMTE